MAFKDWKFIIASFGLLVFGYAISIGVLGFIEGLGAYKGLAYTVLAMILVQSFWLGRNDKYIHHLHMGPFAAWVRNEKTLRAWCLWRALALSLIGLTIIGLIGCTMKGGGGIEFFVGSAIGLGIMLSFISLTDLMRFPFKFKSLKPIKKLVSWLNLPLMTLKPSPNQIVFCSQWRKKIGPFSRVTFVTVLFLMATLLGRLSVYSQAGAEVGFSLVFILSLMASIGLCLPSLALVKLLSREPINLWQIFLKISGVNLICVFLASLLSAGLAGLELTQTIMLSSLVVVAMTLWLGLLIPVAITRTPAHVHGFVGMELFSVAIIKSVLLFGVVAAVYFFWRILYNWRRAEKYRYRDCQ